LAFEGPPGTAVTVRFPLVRRAGHPAEEPEDLGEEERERADGIGAVPRSEDRGTGS
jgi:hypothetical protein